METTLEIYQLGILARYRYTQCLFSKQMKGGDATHTGTASLLLTHTLKLTLHYTRRSNTMTNLLLNITCTINLNAALPWDFLLNGGPIV